MKYSVRILSIAKAERRRIYRYIAERAPEGAKAWEAAYEAAIARLEQNPLICGLAAENEHFDFDLRQLVFKTRFGLPYRIVFRVDDNVVTIYRVRGPGQSPLAGQDS